MSGNTKKTPRSRTPRRSTKSGPGKSAGPESAEMSGNERKIEIPALTPRQQPVLPSFVLSPSIPGEIPYSGVDVTTLRRWMEEPAFRGKLKRQGQEASELARRQLQALMPTALAIMVEAAAKDPDPTIRLRAARYLLSSGKHFSGRLSKEIEELRQLVRRRQQAAEAAKATKPLP